MSNNSNQSVRHLLLLTFRRGVTPEQIQASFDQFRALTKKISGITGFEHGVHDSPEGKNRGFTHACLLTFESIQARDNYLPHPDHLEFGRLYLGPIVQEILVFDYAVKD